MLIKDDYDRGIKIKMMTFSVRVVDDKGDFFPHLGGGLRWCFCPLETDPQ